jgi:hypothetical protein
VLSRTPGAEAAGRSLVLLVTLAFLNSLFEPTFSGNLYFTLFWWIVGVLDADPPALGVDAARTGDELRGGQGVISPAQI